MLYNTRNKEVSSFPIEIIFCNVRMNHAMQEVAEEGIRKSAKGIKY